MRLFNYLKGKNIKNILVLSIGAVLAQVLNFVCSLFMTRIYPKDEIGIFTFIVSIVTIFSAVINARYDVSLVSAEDEEVNSLIKLSLIICLILSLIISACIWGYYYVYPGILAFRYIYFIFALLVIYGIVNILTSYNNRCEDYGVIAKSTLSRTFLQSILIVIFGFIKPDGNFLVLSQVIGQLAGIKSQGEKLFNKLSDIVHTSKANLLVVLKKYKKQPLYSVPSTFVNALSYSIISIIIGNHYGMAILALYSISVRVLGIPLNIFSSNIAKVHYKEANKEILANGNFFNSTRKMLILGGLIGGCMFVLLELFSEFLFIFLYGETWKQSGTYVEILAPMFAMRLVVGSVGFSFIISNKQQWEFFFQTMLLMAVLCIAGLSRIYAWNITEMLYAVSIGYSVIYMIESVCILVLSREIK